MTIKTCRLVELIDDDFVVSDYPIERFAAAMADRGHAFTGSVNNPRQREELQGQAKYAGICGPMWDDGVLRYESIAAYAALSM